MIFTFKILIVDNGDKVPIIERNSTELLSKNVFSIRIAK